MKPVIGTAGWSIPRDHASAFSAQGTSLERYSQVFSGVEINSSFHRSHRASTWAKWAASVPHDFRFAVKTPKTITHQHKLIDVDMLIEQFASEVRALGAKLSVALVQLPPKLVFDSPVADRFFRTLRDAVDVQIVCEPRNASWFEGGVGEMLAQLHVARVATDPALSKLAAAPGGWRGIEYRRLHGSPVMYRSPYSDEAISQYAQEISVSHRKGVDTWCMFDNTASSAAMRNALSLREKV